MEGLNNTIEVNNKAHTATVSSMTQSHYQRVTQLEKEFSDMRELKDSKIAELCKTLEENRTFYELNIDSLKTNIKVLELTVETRETTITTLTAELEVR